MERIGIRMLGEFVVVMDGREICGPDCRRGQMWNLLQYLATFRAREIPAAELQAALWPNGTGNAANALKNLSTGCAAPLRRRGWRTRGG